MCPLVELSLGNTPASTKGNSSDASNEAAPAQGAYANLAGTDVHADALETLVNMAYIATGAPDYHIAWLICP